MRHLLKGSHCVYEDCYWINIFELDANRYADMFLQMGEHKKNFVDMYFSSFEKVRFCMSVALLLNKKSKKGE